MAVSTLPGLDPESLAGLSTRDRILRAAVALFATKGYAATSLSDIEELVQVKRGALYYHISTKQELLYMVVTQYVSDVLAVAEQAVAEGTGAERLRGLIRTHVVSVIRYRHQQAITIRDLDHLAPDRAAELREVLDRVDALWHRALDTGAADGTLAPTDTAVMNAIIDTANGPWRWFDEGGTYSPEQLGERYADLWLRALAP